MVFEKPTDIIVILSIFSLVMVVVGLAITDINNQGSTLGTIDNSYYTRVTGSVNSSAGFQGMAADSLKALSPDNATSEERTEDNILTQGFTGLLNLGQTWGLLWDEFNEATINIGIPRTIIIILSGLLGISFFIVLYTWIRSRS